MASLCDRAQMQAQLATNGQSKSQWSPLRTEPPSRHAESLSGLIERVTFFNEENGWAVLKVKAKAPRPCCRGRLAGIRQRRGVGDRRLHSKLNRAL